MKKYLFVLIIFIILICLCIYYFFNIKNKEIKKEEKIEYKDSQNSQSAMYNGWLHTKGSLLLNEKNEKIQLKGLSSHGIQWFPDILTYENLKILKNDWNTNVFRIVIYTDSSVYGYIANNEEWETKLYELVDYAVNLDMYAIIDWHVLVEKDPLKYKNESNVFFDKISKKYANTPNILYEICNEPNGEDITWNENVKPYAENIISTIRKNSPNSLIIVGTPDWCKDISSAISNPLNEKNILYSFHFYASMFLEKYQETLDNCINNGFPIIVSECGLTDTTGNSKLYKNEFNKWIDYLNSNSISWIYWSFSNKDEASAIINTKYKKDSDNGNISNFLTESGEFIYSIFNSYGNN